MNLKRSIQELPKRIQDLLGKSGIEESNFLCALKTDFKPNMTIPILWVVVSDAKLFLCNTHRTRGEWASYNPEDINCIRLNRGRTGRLEIEIIHSESDRPNLCLPLPINTSPDDAAALITICNRLTRPNSRQISDSTLLA